MANKQTGNKAGPGRPKGSPNKTTAALKEAILLAAEQVGEDGKGKGELTGYLRFLAKGEPKAFAGLLGKVLPMQVTGEDGGAVIVEIHRFAHKSS
ncbi:Phage protein [Devosia sp. DBB001]|nr:Phage protein [Devosia sp. DBB001]